MTKKTYTFAKNEVTRWAIPNYWDAIAIVLVLTLFGLLVWGTKAMLGQYHLGQKIFISLNPVDLPYYALRSVLRMFIALFCSLLFTFIFGTWAAKSKTAERIIIPAIDILQSVPVLGFLSITAVAFVVLFRGSMLGPECAAIFAIFTAQVWNITLSFYQSLKTLPENLTEAAHIFRLSAWQKFWRIEVPFAMPGLIWNMMMSMSGSWVFLVASEAITVAHQNITLPGIGSYTALAIAQANYHAIAYVIIVMFIVIALYDQLLFRPLVAWAEKFKADDTGSDEEPESWLLHLFQSTRLLRWFGQSLSALADFWVNCPWFIRRKSARRQFILTAKWWQYLHYFWLSLFIVILFCAFLLLARFIFKTTQLDESLHVLYLGSLTGLRVVGVILLSSLVWVPIGVWIGLNPKVSRIAQPIAQFLAAFPVNLLFPIVTVAIIRYHLNVNIWISPLMVLGTQWYILFNVIAGTIALPKNLRHAAGTLNVRGWLWWKRLALPGIFPYYITGAITAAGGAWNISIIAEVVSWGHKTFYAQGLGSYITRMYNLGDFPKLALGIVVMSFYVLLLNRLVWRPLYNLAERRFQIR
ncbi:MAG: ABC transporter permease subunit [Gammaproteobacteria bacterium]|nr:ABC transporter permease subunit [Gammaproteobacteria bacterium]